MCWVGCATFGQRDSMSQNTFNPTAGVMPQDEGEAVPPEVTRILWQR
jgi:hypothetical protein